MTLSKKTFSPVQQKILNRIQVNIPFTMLAEKEWQDLFFDAGLNPEIGLAAEALDTFSLAVFQDFAQRFHTQNRTITLHGPFLDLSPGSPDPKIREATAFRFHQLLDAVSVFKPITVVCHAGYDRTRHDFCRKTWCAHAVSAWQWLAKEVHRRGSRLMLENVYEKHPDELLQVLELLNPEYAGHCLDAGHLAAFGKYPLDQWLKHTGKYIGQFHLHDNCGDHDSHLGMGKGNIDFRPVFEFINARSTKPVITLEPHQKEDFLASLVFLEQTDFLSLFP